MKKNSKCSQSGLKTLKTIFASIVVALFVFSSAIIDGSFSNAYSSELPVRNADTVDSLKIYRDSLDYYDNILDSIKTDLIGEVNTYIRSVAKRSRMTAEHIVDRCIENEFDISLLMAQAHQETHFAVTSTRNNVFGIGKRRYSHPNKAVDDYIELMQSRYIINRTPEQLIKSGFKMENSKRKYNPNSKYAPTIRKIRDNIIGSTDIHNLFYEYLDFKTERESFIEGYF